MCEALWFGNDVLKKQAAAAVPLMKRQEREEEIFLQSLVLVWSGI